VAYLQAALPRLLVALALGAAATACSHAGPSAQVRDACAAAVVREDSLHTHVEELSARFAPRDFAHPENLARAAEYLARELGASTREQRFQVEGSAYTNLIASFGPDTPERIVVGAHYDTAGDQPGADDNASGVAGVLDLARLLAANPPAIRTELALWTLEEPPNFRTRHMGSAVHAAQLAAEKARVRLMISVEMIGYFSDAEGSQKLPTGLGLFYPSTGHFIAVVGKWGQGAAIEEVAAAMRWGAPLPVEKLSAPSWMTGVDFSDHLNFWAHGYDAVMVTDTSFFRNANYHTKNDKPNTLDYQRMALAVRGLHCAVRQVAGG
jgi:hypothetical protein